MANIEMTRQLLCYTIIIIWYTQMIIVTWKTVLLRITKNAYKLIILFDASITSCKLQNIQTCWQSNMLYCSLQRKKTELSSYITQALSRVWMLQWDDWQGSSWPNLWTFSNQNCFFFPSFFYNENGNLMKKSIRQPMSRPQCFHASKDGKGYIKKEKNPRNSK